MTMKLRASLLAAIAMLLLAPGATSAHAAAPTFTQRYLAAVVNPDGSVTGRATISASAATTVGTYGIWVRGTTGNKPGVAYRTNVQIATNGTSISGSNHYPAGTYTYGVYVVNAGKSTTVGSTLTFTVPPPPRAVLFEDDFNGPSGQSFDHAKWQDWSACTYHASAAYGNIRCGDTETLDGSGHLRIPADPTNGSSLSTATKFSFVYGEVAAWIKVPAADGYWPAFWTLNSEQTCCSAKTLPVGELDIMEQYTTWDNFYNRAFHNWNGDSTWHGGIATCGGVDLTAGFHKYSARLEPGKVTYFFDDVQCGRTIDKALGDGKQYAFGPDLLDPNWLILTLAVGGAGGQQNPATVPVEMLVDRVEVRSL